MANGKFLQWLADRGSRRMIVRNKGDYLERFFLYRGPKLSIHIHRFWQSDPDVVHDHPWASVSWIIKGSYREYFVDNTYIDRHKGDKTLRGATTFHRIELLDEPGEVISLFFTWKRKRSWGFLTKDGWISASDFTEQPVEVYGRDYIFEGRFFPKFIRLRKGE